MGQCWRVLCVRVFTCTRGACACVCVCVCMRVRVHVVVTVVGRALQKRDRVLRVRATAIACSLMQTILCRRAPCRRLRECDVKGGGSGGVSVSTLVFDPSVIKNANTTICKFVPGRGGSRSDGSDSYVECRNGTIFNSTVGMEYTTPVRMVTAHGGKRAIAGVSTRQSYGCSGCYRCTPSVAGAGGKGNELDGQSGSSVMHRAAVRFRGMEAGVGGQGELTHVGYSSPHQRGGDGLIIADLRTRSREPPAVGNSTDPVSQFASKFPLILDTAGRVTWTVFQDTLTLSDVSDAATLLENVAGPHFSFDSVNVTALIWGSGGGGQTQCKNGGECSNQPTPTVPGSGGGSGGFTSHTFEVPIVASRYRTKYAFDVGRGGGVAQKGASSKVSTARSAWIDHRFVAENELVLASADGGLAGTVHSNPQFTQNCGYGYSRPRRCQTDAVGGAGGQGDDKNGNTGSYSGGVPVRVGSYQGGAGGEGQYTYGARTTGRNGMIVLILNGVRLSRADPVCQRGCPGLHGDPVHGTCVLKHSGGNISCYAAPPDGECGENAAKCPAQRQVTTSTTTTTALCTTANITCGAHQYFDGDCNSTAALTRQQNCVDQPQCSREQYLHGGSSRAQGMCLKCPPADACPAGQYRTKTCEDARVLPCLVQPTCAHGDYLTGASAIRRGECVQQPTCPVNTYLEGASQSKRGTCTKCKHVSCPDDQHRTGSCDAATRGYVCTFCANRFCGPDEHRLGQCSGLTNGYRCVKGTGPLSDDDANSHTSSRSSAVADADATAAVAQNDTGPPSGNDPSRTKSAGTVSAADGQHAGENTRGNVCTGAACQVPPDFSLARCMCMIEVQQC